MKATTADRINNTIGKLMGFKKPIQDWDRKDKVATAVATALVGASIAYDVYVVCKLRKEEKEDKAQMERLRAEDEEETLF